MFLIYIFGTSLLFIAIGAVVNHQQLQRIRRRREGKGFTRENFIETFRSMGIPDRIPAAVFDFYSSQKVWESLPFAPTDTYKEVLCDAPDDIDDDATQLLEKLGLIVPPERILREYSDRPIADLKDMILWLHWVSQHQPERANPAVTSGENPLTHNLL